MLPGIGRLGAGSCTIFSQRRQDFLSRAICRTVSYATTRSRISLMSSPTSRRSPPAIRAAAARVNLAPRAGWPRRHVDGGAACARPFRRRSHWTPCRSRSRRRGGGIFRGGDQQILEGQFQLFDLALDLLRRLAEGLLLELAMRSRSVWIKSCARIVADIFAFSACKAATIAFRTAGSSGRNAASFDMPSSTTSDPQSP